MKSQCQKIGRQRHTFKMRLNVRKISARCVSAKLTYVSVQCQSNGQMLRSRLTQAYSKWRRQEVSDFAATTLLTTSPREKRFSTLVLERR